MPFARWLPSTPKSSFGFPRLLPLTATACGLRCGCVPPGTRPSRFCEKPMKFCMNCHRTTSGKPMFCNFCGASYSVKICPRHHINPRSAEACSQCGSRDLSQPQLKVPFLLKPLLALLGIAPGILLLVLLIGAVGLFLRKLVQDP